MDFLVLHSKELLLLLLLAVAAGLWFLLRFRRTMRLFSGSKLTDGQVADAVVLLSEEHQGSYLQGDTYYTFQVHVKPARGRNFVTEVHVLREQLKRIPQAGDRVSVRFNYTGKKRHVVLNLDSIEPA